jgi:polysaccharide pyruvyl transferase WcaK-like protein
MNLPYEPVRAFDLAGLLPAIYGARGVAEAARERILGVSVCGHESHVRGDLRAEEHREGVLLEALKLVARLYSPQFHLFILNDNPRFGDRALTRRFAAALRPLANVQVVPYSADPKVTWQRISECTAFLSVRLHGAVMACFARVPFLLVEYHQKCSDFLSDLQYGSSLRIGDAAVSANYISGKLIDMLSRPDAFPAREDLLQRLTTASFLNFQLNH